MTIKTIIVSKENFKRKRELVEELSGEAEVGVKAGSLKNTIYNTTDNAIHNIICHTKYNAIHNTINKEANNTIYDAINDPQWYVVQGSDTTMMPIAASCPDNKYCRFF